VRGANKWSSVESAPHTHLLAVMYRRDALALATLAERPQPHDAVLAARHQQPAHEAHLCKVVGVRACLVVEG
jgi:hypothetical protein